MPDPVRVTVSDVRREIYRAAGYAGSGGRRSTHSLGSLFHRVFQSLMSAHSELSWTAVLDTGSLGDSERLREHAYDSIVGPWLRQNQAALQGAAGEVVGLWEATGHLCGFICQLLKNSFDRKTLQYDSKAGTWAGADQFAIEESLTWLVEDDRWIAPVLVTGTVDAVWRVPASSRWCALELKLGAGSSEADLAQLCLYHEMLRSSGANANGTGSIVLYHFKPELTRMACSEEQIEPLKPKLHDLIGRLAGVSGCPGVAEPHPTIAHRELGGRLVQVLEQFGPMVALESDPVVGPSFLRFHIMPKPGVKVDKILPLGRDLAVQLRLAKPALVRLEGGTLLVDLERPDREDLFFAEFRPLLPRSNGGNSKVLVGVDLNRQPRFADLAEDCPHMLAAGTAGSGKSEWLLSALASLVDTNTPETLQLVLIDRKRVTLGQFQRPEFLIDKTVLSTPDEAIAALQYLVAVMEERYSLLARHGCTDLKSLQQKTAHSVPPRIVCFCDEYGNLVAKKKDREVIELLITQLGAKARAAGIHLIIATQDPRATIVSPALRANLSGRVCLKTVSSVQSRIILEENGAESLLGRGDLLFKVTGEALRLQSPLVGEAERKELFGS